MQIKEDGKAVALGIWISTQKKMLNKYRGKTVEEIKNDESINQEEKRRVVELLKLGIQSSREKITSQNIGQVTYTASALECDEASNLIGNLLKEKII